MADAVLRRPDVQRNLSRLFLNRVIKSIFIVGIAVAPEVSLPELFYFANLSDIMRGRLKNGRLPGRIDER